MGFYRRAFQSVCLCLGAVVSRPVLAQAPILQGLTGIQIEYKQPTNCPSSEILRQEAS